MNEITSRSVRQDLKIEDPIMQNRRSTVSYGVWKVGRMDWNLKHGFGTLCFYFDF
ncbi:hypothetical protein HanPSC8_Chr12g0520551 [Helianthus annuus]|nr:hypothetical protein HanPSC8_Chr12g0520551 [Helianthus annuus]